MKPSENWMCSDFFETLAKIIGEQEGVVIAVKSIRLKEPEDKGDSAEAS